MPVLAATRIDWYLTRSTGAVVLLLLTTIVVLGVLGPIRLPGSARWPRFTVGVLHRDLSLLALVVLGVHIVTSVVDSFAPIGWLDAVIPLHSAYRPVWVGFGAVAFDLLLVLVATSLIRRRLGYARWRRIHWLAYGCWPIAVAHGLGTGSDARAVWFQWLAAVCVIVTAGAVAVRVVRARAISARARRGWLAAVLAAPVGILGFALLGPLQSGWAARAGTPTPLLRPHAARTAAVVPRVFAERVSGRVRRSGVPGGALIDLELWLAGSDPGLLRIRLAGHPLAGGGLSLVGSDVEFNAPGLGGRFAGAVSRLDGGRLHAVVRQVGGAGWTVTAALAIGSAHVTGRVEGAAVH